MEERLQKIVARAGLASRRGAEELIRAGRVTVNGIPGALGSRADREHDMIAVDGRPLDPQVRHVYLMLNKPGGYMCTRADPEGRPTVFDLVPKVPGLFTVGRLDRETEGLLLFTTDGAWAERLAHPRYTVEREYEVSIRGPVDREALERLRSGSMLEGRLARPVSANEVHRAGFASILSVVMVEGRRREVRLLCAAAGLPVKRLVRKRFGSLLLGWLASGAWRELEPAEVAALSRSRHLGRTSLSVTARGGPQDPRTYTHPQEASERGSDRAYRHRRTDRFR